MSKVRIEFGSYRAIGRIMKSDALAEQLEAHAQRVFDAAFQDPNEAYTATLQIGRFTSSGPRGRVSVQVGAAPGIGERVEAKRGTLARAMGQAGLK